MKKRLCIVVVIVAALSSLGSVKAYADQCDIVPDELTEIRTPEETSTEDAVSLEAIRWFEGAWEGKVFGLRVEHHVLPEVGGQIPGLVRLSGEDGVAFYELSSFTTEDGQLVYRNRLFNPDLSAQQSGEAEFMTRAAIAARDDIVFFDGITFAANGQNCSVVSFILPDAEGVVQKYVVSYSRMDGSTD